MSNTDKDDDGVSELDLGSKVGQFCKKMDADGFMGLISGHRKDIEVFKNELPNRLFNMCLDPGKLVLDAIEKVFSKNDVGWACVLIWRHWFMLWRIGTISNIFFKLSLTGIRRGKGNSVCGKLSCKLSCAAN